MTFPFPFIATKVRPAPNPVNIYTQSLPSAVTIPRRNYRIVINAARITVPATRLRINFVGGNIDFLNAFVGRQAATGSAWFADTTDTALTRITWGGANLVNAPTTGVWSDWIDFPIPTGKNLLITFDVGAGSARYFAGTPANTVPYFKTTATEEAELPSPTGYAAAQMLGLGGIDISA